ncbi:hypothetical protein [Nonomuraea antimicrobica]
MPRTDDASAPDSAVRARGASLVADERQAPDRLIPATPEDVLSDQVLPALGHGDPAEANPVHGDPVGAFQAERDAAGSHPADGHPGEGAGRAPAHRSTSRTITSRTATADQAPTRAEAAGVTAAGVKSTSVQASGANADGVKVDGVVAGGPEGAVKAAGSAIGEPEGGDPEGGGPGAGSVGRIGGLLPRRRPGDGGEASGDDVDLVDALAPTTHRTVADWLAERSSAATRQARLQVLAAFLRWLRATEPALDLLAVTGAHLDAYCDGALAGTLITGVRTPGRPLAKTTVSRKRAVLSSFYTFAWRSGAVRHDLTDPGPAALTRKERLLLRRGIARLAADGRAAEAAAVALLDATGAPPASLAGLTLQDLRAVVDGEPAIVTVHNSRGDLVAFPIPPLARPLLVERYGAGTAGEPLIRRPDGQPVDARWLGAALTQAALAGGLPRRRAELLDPQMLRAATATELIRDRAARPKTAQSRTVQPKAAQSKTAT